MSSPPWVKIVQDLAKEYPKETSALLSLLAWLLSSPPSELALGLLLLVPRQPKLIAILPPCAFVFSHLQPNPSRP